jgi:hypothetical protein
MVSTLPRRFHLCTVEKATDISAVPARTPGTLCLTRLQDAFFLHWNPLDGTSTQHVTAVFQASKTTKEDCWDPGRTFVFDCQEAQLLQLEDNPLRFSLTRTNKPGVRRFEIPPDEFLSLAQLVEQLLVNGIGVPGTKEDFCAAIYRHRGAYAYTPPHIQTTPRFHEDRM